MGPCAVCGGTTIDAAGNCTQCGNYRGTGGSAPGYPPAGGYQQPGYSDPGGYQQQPGGYPGGGYPTSGGPSGYPSPTSGPGYPTSGQPGYPAGGQPGYAAPVSGQPGYPTSPPGPAYPGGGFQSAPQQAPTYPTAYPPPEQPKRRGMTALLIALVVVVLVLACGTGLVYLGLQQEEDPLVGPTTSPTYTSETARPTEGTAANPNIDPCTIGTWEATSHVEDLAVDAVGTIKLTGGKGTTLTLKDDGTGVTDYGSGTTWTGSLSGQDIKLEIKGDVTFSYSTKNGKATLTNVKSNATFIIYVNGDQSDDAAPFEAGTEASDYTCSGDSLVQSSATYTIEYDRA